MSYCKREGKDKSVFITKEDVTKAELVSELVEEDGYGIILPNGDINWDCPCLGGLAQGSCGEEFKAAFSCFHYSEAEEKGMDCIPQFRGMQECFEKFPDEYGKYSEEEEEEKEATVSETTSSKSDDTATPQSKSEPHAESSSGSKLESATTLNSVPTLEPASS